MAIDPWAVVDERPAQPGDPWEVVAQDPVDFREEQAKVSAQPSFMRRVGNAAPGIIGTVAGGVLGGPVAAAAGGALGETIRQVIHTAPGDLTPAQRGRMVGTEAALGAVSELGTRILGRRLPNLFRRNLPTDAASDLRILEREKIPYTAGDFNPGGTAQITENLMRGTFLGSRIMQRSDVTQASKLSDFRTKVVNALGPYLSREETGQAMKSAVTQRHEELFAPNGIFSRAYKRLNTLYPASVDTSQIRQQAAPIKAELDKLIAEGRLPSASSPEAPSRFYSLIRDLTNYGTKSVTQAPSTVLNQFGQPVTPGGTTIVDVPITYSDIWKDKQTIDSIIRNLGDDNLRTRAKAIVKQVHNILDTAMEAAAIKVNPRAAQSIRQVNKAYGEAKRLFETESLVADIGNMDPERIAQRLFPPGAVTAPKELVRAIQTKPIALQAARRRLLENVLEPLTYETEGVSVVSGRRLGHKWPQIEETLRALKTPQPQIESFREFISAATRAQMSGTMTNPASGRQLLAWSQVGAVLQGIGATAGIFAGRDTGEKAGLAGVAVFGPLIVAKALTSPAVARLLVKGFTLRPGTTEAVVWLPRALNALRIAESQIINERVNQSLGNMREDEDGGTRRGSVPLDSTPISPGGLGRATRPVGGPTTPARKTPPVSPAAVSRQRDTLAPLIARKLETANKEANRPLAASVMRDVQESGASPAVAEALQRVREEADQVARDSALKPDARRQKLQELRQRYTDILGKKAVGQ
jgi:hypothetical protein